MDMSDTTGPRQRSMGDGLGRYVNQVTTAMLILPWLFVSLRFYSRKLKAAGYYLDDWLLVAALVSPFMLYVIKRYLANLFAICYRLHIALVQV